MGLNGQVAIVGAYESPRRKAPGMHPFALQAECVRGALEDAGLSLADVDGFCTAAGFPGEGGAWMDTCEVAEWLGIHPTFLDGTDTGGAAPLSQAGHAAAAIATGLADVVVVSYAACSYSGAADFDTPPPGWGPYGYEAPYGLTTVAAYALAAQRHMHERRHDPGAARADRGAVPGERGREPGRALPRTPDGRGRARLARDRLAAAAPRLLRCHGLGRRDRADRAQQGSVVPQAPRSGCSGSARRPARCR